MLHLGSHVHLYRSRGLAPFGLNPNQLVPLRRFRNRMAQLLSSPVLLAPEWLENLVTPVAQAVGLPKLAGVVHIAAAACAASFALQFVSHVVSPALFPRTYPKIRGKQDDWDLHVVGRLHLRACVHLGERSAHLAGSAQVGWAYAIIATPLALSLIFNPSPEITADPFYGYGVAEGRLSAIATGYFLWVS